MAVPQHLEPFWRSFAAITETPVDGRFYEAFYFGDSETLANELADLVLAGKKRGTAASVWSAESEGKRLPRPGDLSIVINWSGEPLCVIETESVNVAPFNEVQADFAAAEGEGDGSLEFWREAHRRYFSRECLAAGREFSESMLVACERFKVLYSVAGGA
ncbi:MAG: ASCH domain-containing protein [Blastocatellia bacterium]|nr:ASCH domain-containing protein [Blastocatellia bacterium]